ncbi:MAG: hypothetical protein AAF741_12365 [Bacteroidota bacterium]
MRQYLIASFALLAISHSAYAQNEVEFGPGNYMLQALEDINLKLESYLPASNKDYGWRPELCLAGAILDLGETIALDIFLEADTDYVFVGGGDDDVTVLDAYLVSSSKEVVASDILDDRTPIVSYTPEVAGMYSLRLQLVGCNTPLSFVSVAILQKGGGSFDEVAFDEVSSSLIANTARVNASNEGLTYHSNENQWSTFGFFLQPGQESTIENLDLSTEFETQWIVSASQKELQNIDILLLDSSYGFVAGDQADDNYPLFNNSDIIDGESYILQAKAVSGTRSGLFLFSVLN